MTQSRSRPARIVATLLGAWCGAAALTGGCVSRPEHVVSSQEYVGPSVTIDSAGEQHVVVIESPSPGWEVRLDRVSEAERRKDVFVTLRRPDPRFVYAMVVGRQHLATTVDVRQAVQVCVRVLDFGDEAAVGGAYPSAAKAPARVAPPVSGR
jgi:hypothetical protein